MKMLMKQNVFNIFKMHFDKKVLLVVVQSFVLLLLLQLENSGKS